MSESLTPIFKKERKSKLYKINFPHRQILRSERENHSILKSESLFFKEQLSFTKVKNSKFAQKSNLLFHSFFKAAGANCSRCSIKKSNYERISLSSPFKKEQSWANCYRHSLKRAK